jgi:hypothetical protein
MTGSEHPVQQSRALVKISSGLRRTFRLVRIVVARTCRATIVVAKNEAYVE